LRSSVYNVSISTDVKYSLLRDDHQALRLCGHYNKEINVNIDSQNYIQWFRQSSPYINTHRGKTFVLMLPGAALLDHNFSNIIGDIALLNSLGIKLILVHGARAQIDKRLAVEGLNSQFHQQKRITTVAQLPAITQAIGEAKIHIEAALCTGLPNSPMHHAHIKVSSGNFIMARPWGVVEGVDLEHTGKVRRIDTDALQQALNNDSIVILPPLGYSLTGEVFNLSFAEVATEVACAVHADKLIAFSSADGYLNEAQQLMRELNLASCQTILQSMSELDDSSLSLQACFEACQRGVPRTQIVSYKNDGALLQELFTRDGSGTLVHSDTYETIREASITDVGGLLKLIQPLEEQGVLVRRSRELLEAEIDRFMVLEKDGAILACAAIYPCSQDMAELACVATHPDYHNQGLAASLLSAIEHKAKQMGHTELFVLTTQTAHWFMAQGFIKGALECLPTQRKSLYNMQRNSKIFIKPIR